MTIVNLESPFLSRSEKEKERAAKRQAVLLAAVKIFNSRGFHSTSLDDVAQSLGISKPTIYHYLGNKEQVLLTCVEEGLNQLIASAEEISKRNITGYERLREFLYVYGCRNLDDFGRCVILTSDDSLSPEGLVQFKALKKKVQEVLLSIIESAIDDKSIDNQYDPKILAFTLTGAINWSAKWYSDNGKKTKEETVKEMIEILTHGIMPNK
ncbi:TetR family transcriptional regulator [Acinetobacter johnsonii]|uniref:TetR/AcrR family transcriptional regulator n=1 Tax=Acinetobacter TaxID=469 RepID=UPI00132B01CC|nr:MULTISPECIES: TetR/AcrR family transcriptional regulator [Acinetobacter]MWC18521.1 TetR family transcriptional regulator [Acinetobacter johnsonii]NAR65084.1 TetR family transcriptional regulator [Acinetobacter haemolyticus]